MRIYLIGYMGAGKTSFGKILAHRLNMQFFDTDHYIEKQNQCTINEIFSQKGEQQFRSMERQALEEISILDNIVFATGGGLPCFGDNMDYMKSRGAVVYLEVDASTLAARLEEIKATRPLLKDKNRQELEQSVKEMLQKREPYYSKANITIDASDMYSAPDLLYMAVQAYSN